MWFQDKDKDLSLKDEDKDKDLKIGPRGSSRTRTFLEDNNTEWMWLLVSVYKCGAHNITDTFLSTLHILVHDILDVTYAGYADIVKELLLVGASTEVHDEDDLTPLLLTIFTGRNDITKLLISGGACVNTLASHGYSALHHAAWDGNVEVVRLLLDNSAREDDPTDDGNTPLALAAHGGCDDILELLIRRGCSVNNSDKSVLVKLLLLALSYLFLVKLLIHLFLVPCTEEVM